jgi:hypothetical protein
MKAEPTAGNKENNQRDVAFILITPCICALTKSETHVSLIARIVLIR